MSSNYDMEPPDSPPWWPGIAALVVLAASLLSYIYCKY